MVIVAGIVAAHGLPGLLMMTMMAGVILLFLAVTGLGKAVRFIPCPVVVGFTNGIALLMGLGNIGPTEAKPVMEGPAILFKNTLRYLTGEELITHLGPECCD